MAYSAAPSAESVSEPDADHAFACTLLLSRRLYPQADNPRLGALAELHALPSAGRAHPALADADVTAHRLLQMQRDVGERFALPLRGVPASHALPAAPQRWQRLKAYANARRRGGIPAECGAVY